MPLISAASAVRLGSSVVGRLYVGAALVWPTPVAPSVLAIAATSPVPVGALTGTVGTPLPVPRQAVLVVSAPRLDQYRTPPAPSIIAAPVAATVSSGTALVDTGRVDIDTIG